MNPVQQLGFWLLMAYLFLATSRLQDFYAPGLRLTLVLACCGLATALAGGGALRVAESTLGRLYAGLTIWLALSIPFSLWKGGSAQVFWEDWLKSVTVFAMIAALVHTSRQALITVRTIAWASAVFIILVYLYGYDGPEGRLVLPIGQYSNPNDLAMGLLLAIFFWWFMAANPAHSAVLRLLGLGVLGAAFPLLVRTGSRAAMIVLVVALPMLLLQRSLGGRVRLLVVGAVLIAVTAAALPGYLRERYLTFMEARGPDEVGQPMTEAEQDILASAVESAQGRKKLFLDSLRFTLQHPLLGVGIGMFMVAENEEAVDLGNRGMWRGTHNTYTQFSSEAGIPAFVFLVALLVVSFRILQRMEKAARLSHHPNREQTAAAAAVLRPFLFAIAVGMFFIHMAYTPFIPTLIGVVFGLAVCTLEEIKAAEGPVPALRAAPTGEDRLRAPAGNLQVRGRS